MKLKAFKKYIDECVSNAETTDPEVTFIFGKKELDIAEINQFSVVPDVYIALKVKDEKPKSLRCDIVKNRPITLRT